MYFFLNLTWWHFCVIALLVLIGCIFLNYALKKFNEARIEERFARILRVPSKSQSTQVQEPGIAMEISRSRVAPINTTDINIKNTAGISLVFDQEENNIHHNDKHIKHIASKDFTDEFAKLTQHASNTKNCANFLVNSFHVKIEDPKHETGTIVIRDSKGILSPTEPVTILPKKISDSISQRPSGCEIKDATLTKQQLLNPPQNSEETVRLPRTTISFEIDNLKPKETLALNSSKLKLVEDSSDRTDHFHVPDSDYNIAELSRNFQDVLYQNFNKVMNNKVTEENETHLNRPDNSQVPDPDCNIAELSGNIQDALYQSFNSAMNNKVIKEIETHLKDIIVNRINHLNSNLGNHSLNIEKQSFVGSQDTIQKTPLAIQYTPLTIEDQISEISQETIQETTSSLSSKSGNIDKQKSEISQETIQTTPLSANTAQVLEPINTTAGKSNIDKVNDEDFTYQIQEISDSRVDIFRNGINIKQNTTPTTSSNCKQEGRDNDINSTTFALPNNNKNMGNDLSRSDTTFNKPKGKNNADRILIDNTTTKKIIVKTIPAIRSNIETIDSTVQSNDTITKETLSLSTETSASFEDNDNSS